MSEVANIFNFRLLLNKSFHIDSAILNFHFWHFDTVSAKTYRKRYPCECNRIL